ncbi:hypothetical protein F2Q70_00011348 [Brassica cretica]|uniref:Uncharacterized protein n=2 Tax=Brassica cretica TaxID=69181 RepID=A0A3N6RQG1_BRACR|nr:hypothetical protein F2Q68_00004488 [Brassica cretica]KAF2615690.1 hypothetical protein F2Q70_00011348 [Brassica cretica]KAF3544860.1 hypothetical protein DY000_02006560 [Brassica cretica]
MCRELQSPIIRPLGVRTRQNDRSSGDYLIARSNTSRQVSPLPTAQTPEEDDELQCALATPIDKTLS